MRVAAILLALGAAAAGAEPRIVDLLGPFARYALEAGDMDPARRDALWTERLEAPHRAFFDAVIYRGLRGQERERYRAEECLARFWKDLAPRADADARRFAAVERRLRAVLAACAEKLPGFEASTDFYVTYAFSFRGKVVEVEGRRVLALGMELLSDEGPALEITVAHELFHLHHFRFFAPSGAVYRTLWTEGLATYASAVLVPGQRRSVVLGFDRAKMDRCEALLPAMAAELRRVAGEDDPRSKRIHFGAEENDAGIPPEAGYYVGLLLAERLAREHSLDRLARMPPGDVYPLVLGELQRMVGPEGPG